MIKRIATILLLFSSYSCFSQEEYRADQIAASLKVRANAVIRTMETTVDMRATDNVIMNIKKVITVLNRNGEEQAQIALFYDKSTTIKSAKGIIMDAFGKPISKFTLSNFTDQSAVNDFSLFEDYRVKLFRPSSLSYPYTVIYEYEIRSKQNMVIPDWYAVSNTDVSVENNNYTFVCKPEDKIRIKAFNYPGAPQLLNNEKTTSRTWTVKNLPAIKPEPYAPNPEDYRICIKIAPEDFNYYGHKGRYQNWDELGKWIYNELIKSRQVLNPSTIEEVKELVAGIENDKEKARKVYEFVQRKTRYISVQIGIGGNQPMSANEVHQLSYGDCKALVNYTQALLNAVNIPSYYCVVNAGNLKRNMDADFASMNQGNHIILCVPFKNDTTWLECTDQHIPFGFLGSFTDDRTVLACTADGGKILRTPILSTPSNLLNRKASLLLDADGNINGTLETTFSGAQYDNHSSFVNQPANEQVKQLKQAYDIDNINFDDFKFVLDKGSSPVMKESIQLSIKKYAAQTNDHIYLVLNAFNKERAIPELRNRKLPVFINRGYTDIDEISYQLPDHLSIDGIPPAIAINNSFGSYNVSIKKEGQKLIYYRKFVLNSGTYPAEKYADLVDFISNVSTADQQKAVFKIGLAKN